MKLEALVELSQERSDAGFETRNVGNAVLVRKIVVIPVPHTRDCTPVGRCRFDEIWTNNNEKILDSVSRFACTE